MQLIQTVTVPSGGAASIEFTGIPQDGTDLLLVVSARTNRSFEFDQFAIQLNGSSTGFTGRYLEGDGSSAYSSTSTSFIATATGNTVTANTFGSSSIYFANYTSAANKSISADGVGENNGSYSALDLYATTWANTAAITSVRLAPNSGSLFLQNTVASLYKITKA